MVQINRSDSEFSCVKTRVQSSHGSCGVYVHVDEFKSDLSFTFANDRDLQATTLLFLPVVTMQ
jgi:hypothetical protein